MDGAVQESQVKILFFGKARELAGCKESRISLPADILCADLADRVARDFRLESIRESFILSVNEEFVASNARVNLSERDEIAVIPPLSGGLVEMEVPKDLVKLQEDKLNIAEIVDLVLSPKCGAVSTFIGITRDNFEDKKVTRLEYEAYEPMALKEMRNICAKLRSQWTVQHVAIHHRLGVVPVTEASVIIAISSPHRQESLQAVQFAIDMLKSTVPIWKKEVYDTEESQWKENKECAWSTSDKPDKTNSNKIVKTTEVSLKSNCSLGNIQVVPSEYRQNESNGDSTKERESSETIVDPNLVQIRASSEELNRRIESFIARKRQQVNIVNVQEFCCHRARNEDTEGSCARVDAILIRRKDSKSHVKVHRVLNPWGPQTVDQTTLYKTSGNVPSQSSPNSYPPALEERFSTSEKLLGVNGPVPRDVYQRLKKIEDKILYLESLSPEYRHFWVTDDDSFQNNYKPVRKRTFSTAELDTKLHELEDRYVKRIK